MPLIITTSRQRRRIAARQVEYAGTTEHAALGRVPQPSVFLVSSLVLCVTVPRFEAVLLL